MFRQLCLFLLLFLLGAAQNTFAAEKWHGKAYVQNSQVQSDHAQYLLERYYQFKGDETILDMGTGDGRLVFKLAQQFPKAKVIGVDPSKAMFEQAKQNPLQAKVSNVQFIQASAQDYQADVSFDLITSVHAMHWVKQQEKALSNFNRMLKPGGMLLLVLAPSKEGLPFQKALDKTQKAWHQQLTGFENPQTHYEVDTYKQLLTNVGFRVDEISLKYYQREFSSLDSFKAWVAQWLPQYKYLPANQKDLFLDEFVRTYGKSVKHQANQALPYGEYVMFVSAVKPS